MSDNLQLSQWRYNLKMHSLTENFFWQSVFVTDLEQTPFFLKSDLNINNLLFFCSSEKLKYLAKFSRIYFSLPISLFFYQLERSSLYQTTKVFLAFISITSAPFNIDWLAKFWRWMALFGSFEFNINITSFNVIVNNFQLWSIIVLYLRLYAKCEM